MDVIKCTTKDELKQAIVSGAQIIRIEECDLANKVHVLMKLPRQRLLAALSCAGVAAFLVKVSIVTVPVDVATGGATAAVRFGGAGVATALAVSWLGLAGAGALLTVAAAVGGPKKLQKLYDGYKIKEKGSCYLVIQKKA